MLPECLRTILREVYQNYQTSQFLFLAPHFFCSAAAGFNETRQACCGTGYLETAILCNEASIGTCADAAPYLFWDSFHPTTGFYKMLADMLVKASDPVLRGPPQPWYPIIITISESELISDIYHSYPKEKKISARVRKHLQLCHYLHYSPAIKCNKGRPPWLRPVWSLLSGGGGGYGH